MLLLRLLVLHACFTSPSSTSLRYCITLMGPTRKKASFRASSCSRPRPPDPCSPSPISSIAPPLCSLPVSCAREDAEPGPRPFLSQRSDGTLNLSRPTAGSCSCFCTGRAIIDADQSFPVACALVVGLQASSVTARVLRCASWSCFDSLLTQFAGAATGVVLCPTRNAARGICGRRRVSAACVHAGVDQPGLRFTVGFFFGPKF